MAREDPNATLAKAHNVFIRLALPPYTIHFKSPSYLHPLTIENLDKKVSKETLKATSSTTDVALSSAVREAIGMDAKFWAEWVEVLGAAVPSLERRSFDVGEDGVGVDYESARGALIAGNYPGLWRDLERLNDIVSIGRNVLTVGLAAQNLAAEYGVESVMFQLVHVCVRVTARGYDAEAGTQEEEKWQWVVNAYKKVLITSLQFLNNLVARNEACKTRLWMDLFDAPVQREEDGEGGEEKRVVKKPPPPPPPEPEPATPPEPPFTTHDILLAYGSTGPSQRLSPLEMQAAQPLHADEGFFPIPKEAQREVDKKTYRPNAWVYFVAKHKQGCIEQFHTLHKRSPMLGEIHKNLPHYWHHLDKPALQKNKAKNGFGGLWGMYTRMFQNEMEHYRQELEAWNEAQNNPPRPPTPPRDPPKPFPPLKPARPLQTSEEMEEDLWTRLKETGPTTAPANFDFGAYKDLEYNPLHPRDEEEEADLRMLFSAEAGKKILEQGKVELMRRLEGEGGSGGGNGGGRRHSVQALGESEAGDVGLEEVQKGRVDEARRTGRRRTSEPSLLHGAGNDQPNGEDSLDEEEVDDSDASASDSGSDESYPGSSEDGRGLLTDVPLILGPSEIEVLPMLIMSGIIQPPPKPHQRHLIEWEFRMAPRGAPWEESNEGQRKLREWHCLRTNLLLSQTSGRNLLRELLIFVAAWDLREEELYFKFMLKITEALLLNGLLPYAYHAFRDRSKSKDIISPAQAVLIKLLTSIFRSRTASNLRQIREAYDEEPDRSVHNFTYGPLPFPLYLARYKLAPTRADLQLMTFLFSEFRQHIIPQTCALIFLQGQVRRGRAGSEDFPLNLWDMERMYEGVYQVLEFFAVVVEEIPTNFAPPPAPEGLYGGPAHPLSGFWLEWQKVAIKQGNAERVPKGFEALPTELGRKLEEERRTGEWFSWKSVLGDWEMVSELVTLLRELEEGIPKVNTQGMVVQQQQQVPLQKSQGPVGVGRSGSADAVPVAADAGAGTTPVAVERPFDLSGDSNHPYSPLETSTSEHPLAYPQSSPPAPTAPLSPLSPQEPDADAEPDQDEPADFEWRNLKKLTVLVLSSLVWKNSNVQRQLRDFGGLEVLLKVCMSEDENNPFIREHGVMCLRFAIEGHADERGDPDGVAEGEGARNWEVLCALAGWNFDPHSGREIPASVKEGVKGVAATMGSGESEEVGRVLDEVYGVGGGAAGAGGSGRKSGAAGSGSGKQSSGKAGATAAASQPKDALALVEETAKMAAEKVAASAFGSGSTSSSSTSGAKGKAPASTSNTTSNANAGPKTKQTQNQKNADAHARLASALQFSASAADAELTAARAAELMQNALRNLPGGIEKLRVSNESLGRLADPNLRTDGGEKEGLSPNGVKGVSRGGAVGEREKADALARLDRAFEGAEKALGGGK